MSNSFMSVLNGNEMDLLILYKINTLLTEILLSSSR